MEGVKSLSYSFQFFLPPEKKCYSFDACLRCQAENKQEDCVVVWGECNHSFHNCCMSLWVKQNNRCPLCQQDWVVQRIGK
nr:RING-box protein 2 [Chrysemys picta bellii]